MSDKRTAVSYHLSLITITGSLNSAPLRRAAAVVGDGRRVADGRDADAGAVDGADGRLAAAARALDVHLGLLHPDLFGLVRGLVGGLLRGEGRALARAAEAARARTGLRDEVPLRVRDRNQRVVERRRDVHDADGDVLLLLLAEGLLLAGCRFGHNSVVNSQ